MSNQLPYTIWFNTEDPGNDYMWSLGTAEAAGREDAAGMPSMFAPLIKNGVKHAFTLLKKSTSVSSPERKRDIVKILGADADVDLLANITDNPLYERRRIEESFILLGQNAEHGDYYHADVNEWSALISAVKNYLNTRIGEMRIVLSADRSFYYLGRVSAEVEEMKGYRAVVRVTADCQPYKYERYSSAEPWIWDDFSFIDGIIRDYRNITINRDTAVEIDIPVRSGDVMPIIHRITYNDEEFEELTEGIDEDVQNFVGSIASLAAASMLILVQTVLPAIAMTQANVDRLEGYFDSAVAALNALNEAYADEDIVGLLPDNMADILTRIYGNVGSKTDIAGTNTVGSYFKVFADNVDTYLNTSDTDEKAAAVAAAKPALRALSTYSYSIGAGLVTGLDNITVCVGDPSVSTNWHQVFSGQTNPDVVIKGSPITGTVRPLYIKGVGGTVNVEYRGKAL